MNRILIASFALILVNSAGAAEGHREKSNRGFEISLGAALPVTNSFDKKDPHYAFGLGYSWDVGPAFIEARGDYVNRFSRPGQSYTAFTLGGNFIISEEDLWALYAGANFGFGFTKVEGVDTKGGFQIGGDLGALLLRASDVNLDLRLRLIFNSAEIRDHHPMMLGFLVGIRF